ncbi:MAG TPA: hypothetical protein VNO14_03815, partial [Blastocatellia bacterium]|nr:hypothetical protein [Blastocatellia bacterium]
MKRAARAVSITLFFSLLLEAMPALRADDTRQPLDFSQDWSNTALITANDDWSGVAGITGYRGDGL